jgi:hypothetical protein
MRLMLRVDGANRRGRVVLLTGSADPANIRFALLDGGEPAILPVARINCAPRVIFAPRSVC